MRKLTIILTLLICPFLLYAQDLEDYLSKYTSENGQMYLQPFANAFSANMNTGLYHNAKIKKKGFQLYLGVVSQVAVIPSSAKTFTATIDDPAFGNTMTYPGAPTVFGSPEGPIVENPDNGLSYALPAGLDMDYLPLAMPQLTIGSLFGTDFTLRYFPTQDIEDLGEIKFMGWGFRHSVDQYLKAIPLSLAVGYYHQNLQVGDYVDASTTVLNVQASFAVPVITFYGGLGYESGKVDVEYVFEGVGFEDGIQNGDKIAFELDAEGSIRATLGLCFNLGPVKIHGDYNIAKQNTIAVGLGIGINQK